MKQVLSLKLNEREKEREIDYFFFFIPLNVVSTIFQSYDNDQENVCMVKIQK